MGRFATFCAIFIPVLHACQTGTDSNTAALEDSVSGHSSLHPGDPKSAPVEAWSLPRRQFVAGYYFLVGEYLSMKGDSSLALKYLETAYDLDPNQDLGNKYLAAKSTRTRGEDLVLEARRMALLYPKSWPIRLRLGEIFAREKKFTEAIKETRKAISLRPDLEQGYVQLISILQKKGDPEESLKEIRYLTQKMPQSVFAWSLLSRVLLARKEYRQSATAAKRAYTLQPRNSELLLLHAFLTEKTGSRKKALGLYEEYFYQKVKHEQIIARTVAFYRIFGSLQESLNQLTELSKTRLGSLENLHVQRVFLLWELKRNQDAETLMQYLIAESPYSAWLTYLSAEALLRNGKQEEAKSRFASIRKHSDYFIPSRIKLSRILRAEKKITEALNVVLKLLPYQYVNWETYILASQLMGDLKRYKDAVQVLDDGINKYPLKIRLLFLRGVYEEKSNQIDECISTMREVIEKDPTYSSAYNYLGYLFADRDENLEEAETLILKALELKPNDGYYLDSLGWVYFMKGEPEKALPIFFEALKRAPGEGVILEHIGDVYRLRGQTREARTYYEKALERPLDDQDRKRIESKSKELN